MVSNAAREGFNQIRFAFDHRMEINSLYVITHRMAVLSRVLPKWFDCCVNSCLAFTGEYEKDTQCSLCSEPRLNDKNKPRRMFCYLPLIPRLQRFFSNEKTLKELLYRYLYKISNFCISDVFDSEHYQNLCRQKVSVDGMKLNHRYFSNKHDIAFSICLDGYLLYKRNRGGPSATPILLQIYNWPPEIRTQLGKCISLGVIPGPKGPKLIHTYLHEFEKERVLLAQGVKTFDCIEKEYFSLHAYCIFSLGDIIAIEKLLNIKGHNGKCPCRSCEIKAVNNPDSAEKTYYVPLLKQEPSEIPLRKHEDWAEITDKITKAKLKKDKEKIAIDSGIKGMPALVRVGSLDYARGTPWDFMHLGIENVIKNLVNLWMGKFKRLDSGVEDYIIPEDIWKKIGEETVEAVRNIPSAFVRSLGNIAESPGHYTAEGWAFWFMYLAPILLKGRFKKEKYYNHFIRLVEIMKRCIQFSITHDEIDEMEENIIDWVREYER